DFDLGAAVFGNQHLVTLLHGEIDFLSIFIDFARAESDDFAFLRFFLGGIGNNDAAFLRFLLFDRLHQHPIAEWFYIYCHVFITPSCFLVWVEPATAVGMTIAGKLFCLAKYRRDLSVLTQSR